MMKLLTLLLALGAVGAFELSNRDEYNVQPSSPFGRPNGRVETIQVTPSERAGLRAVGGLCVVGCFFLLGGIRRHRDQGVVMRRELDLLLEQLDRMALPPNGYPIQLELHTARNLIAKNEIVAALELLGGVLAEWEAPLTPYIFDRFVRLTEYYGADPQKCEDLRQNLVDPESAPAANADNVQVITE